MRIVVIAVWLVLAMALGGCLNAEEDGEVLQSGGGQQEKAGQEGGGERSSGVQTGGIRGQVVDVGFSSIAGAHVELLQDKDLVDETETLENGTYVFTGLEPGEYRLKFSASCCKQLVRGANVRPDEVTEVTVQLEEHKPVAGYVVDDVWQGFIGCSGYIPGYGVLFNPHGACANLDPNNDPTHEFQLEPGLKTIVVAMEWDEETTNPMGDMRIFMSKGSGSNAPNRFFTLQGPSPLEIVLGPEDAQGGEGLYFDNIEELWDVQFTVMGSTDGSVVYQQPFTVYYELYYNDPAPDGASAIPG